MKTVKRILVILLIASSLCLTGCWNYRELENLSMVAGVAVDKGQNGYKYHLTFEFLDPSGQSPKSKILETDGNTIFDAVRNAVGISARKLYFSDCKVLLISKDVASDGILPIFDWVARDQEPRITIIPAVSQEKTAGEILKAKGVTDSIVSMEIWRTISQNKTTLSETSSVELYEAINLLGSEGDSMVLATVKATKGQDGPTSELAGSAVFTKDKLVGFLGREETKFFLFLRNEVQGGLLVFSPENDGQNITLELQGCKTNITPTLSGDSSSMKINLNIRAALAEDETTKDYVSENGIKEAEVSAQNYLKTGIEQMIKKVQTQYDSDIFAFGSQISKTDPEYWSKNKSKWSDEFKKLKCTVDTKVTIDNTATTKDKIKVT